MRTKNRRDRDAALGRLRELRRSLHTPDENARIDRAERMQRRISWDDQRPDTKPEVLAPPNPKLRFYQPASGLDRRHD